MQNRTKTNKKSLLSRAFPCFFAITDQLQQELLRLLPLLSRLVNLKNRKRRLNSKRRFNSKRRLEEKEDSKKFYTTGPALHGYRRPFSGTLGQFFTGSGSQLRRSFCTKTLYKRGISETTTPRRDHFFWTHCWWSTFLWTDTRTIFSLDVNIQLDSFCNTLHAPHIRTYKHFLIEGFAQPSRGGAL